MHYQKTGIRIICACFTAKNPFEGKMVHYDPVENIHRNHILDLSIAPFRKIKFRCIELKTIKSLLVKLHWKKEIANSLEERDAGYVGMLGG